MKGSLTYMRKADPKKDHAGGGVLYWHDFKTGHQELVFSNNKRASEWAKAEGCEYVGPWKEKP